MSFFKLFGKDKTKSEFKFSESKNKAVFSCSHVIDEKNPILYISHDQEGDWQFLCGNNNHTIEHSKFISLENAVDLDNTLNQLFEMPIGFGTERKKIGEKWLPFKLLFY
ncbi:MAG: hypothetical protein ACPG4W_06510 [Flavobacteriales bacterium]